MPVMNHQTLPLPNPGDWLTTEGAAYELGVSRRTVERMAEREVLTPYQPAGGPRETPGPMYWRPEVLRVRDARRLSGVAR